MTDAEVQLAPLLNDCDREPIHIPQAIQPHGFLLALDRAPSLKTGRPKADAATDDGTAG